jgi:hypothetical protein
MRAFSGSSFVSPGSRSSLLGLSLSFLPFVSLALAGPVHPPPQLVLRVRALMNRHLSDQLLARGEETALKLLDEFDG